MSYDVPELVVQLSGVAFEVLSIRVAVRSRGCDWGITDRRVGIPLCCLIAAVEFVEVLVRCEDVVQDAGISCGLVDTSEDAVCCYAGGNVEDVEGSVCAFWLGEEGRVGGN